MPALRVQISQVFAHYFDRDWYGAVGVAQALQTHVAIESWRTSAASLLREAALSCAWGDFDAADRTLARFRRIGAVAIKERIESWTRDWIELNSLFKFANSIQQTFSKFHNKNCIFCIANGFDKKNATPKPNIEGNAAFLRIFWKRVFLESNMSSRSRHHRNDRFGCFENIRTTKCESRSRCCRAFMLPCFAWCLLGFQGRGTLAKFWKKSKTEK